jgi:Clostripain family
MAANWTVMVLMGANNLPNEANLVPFANADIKEMQAVSVGTKVNVVVQIDRKMKDGGPERFKIKKNGKEDEVAFPDSDGSAADPDVLASFLLEAKAQYPAKYYMLVIWGHAWRFAFERNGKDSLDFTKLANVLGATNGGKKLDIVAFDSCGVGWLEAAYQLRRCAKYLVATQFMDPLPGWPYTDILSRIVNDKTIKPVDVGRAIVSQFVRHYAKSERRYREYSARFNRDEPASVSMTTLDLARVEDIGEAFGKLATALAAAVHDDASELNRVYDALEHSRAPIKEPGVDLTTFCWNLATFSGSDQVKTAAGRVGDLMLNPLKPFIVAHGISDLSVSVLHGVSVFAPSVRPQYDSGTVHPLYEALDLSQDTMWDELVYALAEPDA